MNGTEDRLRAAGRAVAVTVPPDSMPPLRLPAPAAPEADLRVLRRRRPGGRRPGWLAPLAAAAAVVAVIALSVAVARGPSSGAPAGTEAGPLGTPPYYVALTTAGQASFGGTVAVVRRTATGQAVARVFAPGLERFTMVAAAPDDRTFVLGSQSPHTVPPPGTAGNSRARLRSAPRTVFYLLRFDPARRQAQLSPLRVPVATEPVSGLALSPNGRKMAVATTSPGQMKITVSTLVTGTSRTWSGRWDRHLSALAFNSLSWTNPDKVAFVWWVPGTAIEITVRRLDLSAPQSSLPAASTDLPGVTGAASSAVSPQGVRATFQTGPSPDRGIAAYPTDMRWVSLSRRSAGGTWQDIKEKPRPLWSNPAGTVVIANVVGHQIDVVGHGRFVKLPGTMPTNSPSIAW